MTRFRDRIAPAYLALPAGLAAIVAGLIDDSNRWLIAGLVMVALWIVFVVLAKSERAIRWVEQKYEDSTPISVSRTSPSRFKNMSIYEVSEAADSLFGATGEFIAITQTSPKVTGLADTLRAPSSTSHLADRERSQTVELLSELQL